MTGQWFKTRKPPREYPRTPQQEKIAEAGKKVGEECKGKTGSEYVSCRHEVLVEIFGKKEPGAQD